MDSASSGSEPNPNSSLMETLVENAKYMPSADSSDHKGKPSACEKQSESQQAGIVAYLNSIHSSESRNSDLEQQRRYKSVLSPSCLCLDTLPLQCKPNLRSITLRCVHCNLSNCCFLWDLFAFEVQRGTTESEWWYWDGFGFPFLSTLWFIDSWCIWWIKTQWTDWYNWWLTTDHHIGK